VQGDCGSVDRLQEWGVMLRNWENWLDMTFLGIRVVFGTVASLDVEEADAEAVCDFQAKHRPLAARMGGGEGDEVLHGALGTTG